MSAKREHKGGGSWRRWLRNGTAKMAAIMALPVAFGCSALFVCVGRFERLPVALL
ncbi:MAG: hypothetical protein U5M23_06435 [Marinagarivorans sp.]|nr:hypothetical protein [Marinagarivorans sp.]